MVRFKSSIVFLALGLGACMGANDGLTPERNTSLYSVNQPVVQRTRDFPGRAMTASPGVPAEVKQAVKDAMLKLHEDGQVDTLAAGLMGPAGMTFAPNGDAVERLMYGFSVLHCLPVGMVEKPSAETGTVMRRPIFRRYAEEAGFSRVDELPIENDFYRFYKLTA